MLTTGVAVLPCHLARSVQLAEQSGASQRPRPAQQAASGLPAALCLCVAPAPFSAATAQPMGGAPGEGSPPGAGAGPTPGAGAGSPPGTGAGSPPGTGAGSPPGAGEGTTKPQSQQTAVELKATPTEGSQLSAGTVLGLSVVPVGRVSSWYSHSVKQASSLPTKKYPVKPHLQGHYIRRAGSVCVMLKVAEGCVRCQHKCASGSMHVSAEPAFSRLLYEQPAQCGWEGRHARV